MEMQVIYCIKADNTSKKSRGWIYTALPVPATAAAVEVIKPNILHMLDSWVGFEFLAFLSKIFAQDGGMRGW